MKIAGILVWVIGALALICAFVMETTAPYSDTLNIGLMQNQLMWWQLGLAALIAGSVLFTVGELIELMRGAKMLPTPGVAVPVAAQRPTKHCKWCDKDIASPAVPCASYDHAELRGYEPHISNATCRAVLIERGIFTPSEGAASKGGERIE